MIQHSNIKSRLLVARIFLLILVGFMLVPIGYLIHSSLIDTDPFDDEVEFYSTDAWRVQSGQAVVIKEEGTMSFRAGELDSQPINTPALHMSLAPDGMLTIAPAEPWVWEYSPLAIRLYAEGISSTSPRNATGDMLTLLIDKNGKAETGTILVSATQTLQVKLDMPAFSDGIDRIRIHYERPSIHGSNNAFLIRTLTNSIKLSLGASLLILIMSISLAYAVVRLKVAFKEPMLKIILIAQMFPSFLMLTAYFTIFHFIGEHVEWLGRSSQSSLFIIYLGSITLSVFLVLGYFKQIDPAMEESAFIDGATPFQALRLILLPMSKPIVAVTFMVSFVYFYSEFNIANQFLVFDNLTFSATMYYAASYNMHPAVYATSMLIACLPVVLLFLFIRKYLVAGLAEGSTTGT